jgi:cytochrome c oxidase subunit II
MRTLVPLGSALVALPLASCAGAMDPQGSRADRVTDLWWVMLIIATLVSLLVIGATIAAVIAGRRRDRLLSDSDRGLWSMVLGGGVVLPVLVIPPLLVWSFLVDRHVLAESDDALVVEVVGHQFWWEVRYPEYGVVTANEITIPVNRAVRIELTSTDVIHSFWVPQLGGKADLIPGRTNAFYIEAREPGAYRGQCAEYCGIQHANMRVLVFAHSEDDFETWIEARQAGAPDVSDDELLARGQEVFTTRGCAACHTVRGHGATGRLGPDLTHLQTRQTLAAGTLPNNRGNLAGWILQPQESKPGVLMPATTMPPEELDALLAYLEQLE